MYKKGLRQMRSFVTVLFAWGGHIPRAPLNSPFQTGKYALDLALEEKVRRIPIDISGSNVNIP